MPRLSLYRPEKGNDYKFIDKTVWEMFQVGGTDVLVHKYIGPGAPSEADRSPSTPEYLEDSPLNIQDLLFLENRDRKYDPDVYILRGAYNVQDIDFNLSQFGLFLQNDTIFITFHINDTVEKLGRKIISGDVIELPHLKDEYALNDLNFALKRFYVVEDVNRAAEGFSVTWYPHLYRAKCKPLVDSQEFKQILDQIANTDAYLGGYASATTYYPGDIIEFDGVKYEVIAEVTGVEPPNTTYYKVADTLRDIVSTYEKEMQITEAILDQADADSPKSGYDISNLYSIKTDPDAAPENNGLEGYLLEDGVPLNGEAFTAGIAFPLSPVEGQFHLRTDYLPKRLFRYNGSRWVKVEDALRMTMTNLGETDVGVGDRFEGKDVRQTQKTTFINNTQTNVVNNKVVEERQALSKALKPKAD
jgi:ribosome-associated protein YbcJ (S4-like RNA binding protein)